MTIKKPAVKKPTVKKSAVKKPATTKPTVTKTEPKVAVTSPDPSVERKAGIISLQDALQGMRAPNNGIKKPHWL